MTKYCLPIIEPSAEKVIATINDYSESFDLFEIWLDYLEEDALQVTRELCEKLPSKLLFLFRRQGLEEIQLSEKTRSHIMELLAKKDALLDLDFQTQKTDLENVEKLSEKPKLILSYHNYKETPSLADLLEVYESMKAFSPAIYKFAAFCNSEEDAFTLIELFNKLKEDEAERIVLGMGLHGLSARVTCSLWGNAFTFAPVELEKASAPGQLSRQEFAELEKILFEKDV